MGERITTIQRQGLTFDVFDEGPLDGEVVVLLHGFPERSTSWRYVVPLLHERGYRTIAMDQRGYSPGARPKRRWNYRIRQLTDDVLALIDRIGGPVHLVGHDWGAVPSWAIATQRPDRLRTLTAVSVPHPMAFLRAAVTLSAVPQVLLHRPLPAPVPAGVVGGQAWRPRRHRAAQGRDDRRRGGPLPRARSSTTGHCTTR